MHTPDQFARDFAAGWKQPTTERLLALLHPEVVLLQPHLPPIRGLAAARAEFERLFSLLPTLNGDVDQWRGDESALFIEWRMNFPIGGRTVRIPAVDRFVLRDGVGIERRVFFDQTPLLLAVGASPRFWLPFVRYRFRR